MIATNHTSESMDIFKPGQVVSGGQGFIYTASLVVLMDKLKLKETEGEKLQKFLYQSQSVRFPKSLIPSQIQNVFFKIPYRLGINKYSGLIDFFERQKHW